MTVLFRNVLLLTPSFLALTVGASDKRSFNRDIRPILSDACFACHGFDAKKRKADLRLDTPDGARADLGGYAAIVPGKPEESELWIRLLSEDKDEVMPPPDHHKPLSDAAKETIRQWIEQGAEYQQHWSFVAPEKPPIPGRSTESPVDSFLSDRLKKEGLSPAPEASKETLIRRVTLDLTGLPPTSEEVATFLSDLSPDAYERLVEGLLSRATYGEHMARYWLDLARYADTHGLHLDNERSLWPYRDWVVQAFNENLPFDEFTRWQLAGDLLPKPSRDQRVASGFNRCNVTTSEGGSIDEEWIYRYAVDRTTTAVEVWMGLTAGCAVCHDHKFDPISAKDYYSMYAFFHSAADPAMDGNRIDTPPILKLTSEAEEKRLAELEGQIREVDQRIAAAVAALNYIDPATLDPAPPVKKTEVIWFEDRFPEGSSPQVAGAPIEWNEKGKGPVHSGSRSLRRTSPGALAQDYWSGGASFTVPSKGMIFVYVHLDPASPPEAIMVQFHTGEWKHRAVWGKAEKIPFGDPGTIGKVAMGGLPEAGKWVRLEFPAEKLGLKAGMKVDGYAFTQFGGTVSWDRLGIAAESNPANDPAWSWKIWREKNQGTRNNDLPESLRELVRGKKPELWTEEEEKRVFDFWLAHFYLGARDQLAPLEAEKMPAVEEKKKIEAAIPITFVMADLPQARESFVMERGAYDKPGEKVTRAVPSFLPPLPAKPADREYNRLDFANWLVSGKHPLTARVTVNRFWQQFFGVGLVKTSMDFGSQGEPPSHPELLDWLAVTFVEEGWDVKKLVKHLVTSQAYRRHSGASPELRRRDPENRLLARGPRFRLDAEVLRDQVLFVSGLLVPTMGGKGVKPYQPPNIWEPVGFGNSNTRYYVQDKGESLYRRSLYTFLKRTAPPPFLSSFDAPNREQCCTVRGRSNTPLQALQLMNDIQHVEAARQFAQRILKEGGASEGERIRWAWRAVTARIPEPMEVGEVNQILTRYRNRYESDKTAAKELIRYGESGVDASLNPAELAAYTLVANLLFNLDEVIVKN